MSRNIITAAITVIAMPVSAFANNACLSPSVTTAADVTTLYGAEYEVRTTYRSVNETAAQFIRETPTTIAAEGPLVWTRGETDESIAGDRERRFAIGHQYHAMLLYFDDMMENVERDTKIPFGEEVRSGRTGLYPAGGEVSLIDGEAPDRPAGLIMKLPDESPITIKLADWRAASSGYRLPYRIVINHEDNIFTYAYSMIDIDEMDAIDFQDRYGAPDLDDVHIHRLHRALLAAHCRGDAALMAQLSAPAAVIANRGNVVEVSQDETRGRFETTFERVEYSAYHDLANPIIRVAGSGDLGWAIVNVRAEGQAKKSGEEFSQQWAWAMLAEKRDGVWVHAGNASNAAAVE
ncbi:MAG: nuclear transport factor 2 family protein [Pseudomonadota bacterium]